MNINDQLLDACRDGDFNEAMRYLSEGAQVDTQDEDGHTPLMNAAYIGNLSLAQELVHRGADINLWAQGDNSLMRAAVGGRRQVFEYLADLVSDEIRDSVDEEELERGERLRRRAGNEATEDTILAAAQGKLKEVEEAIAAGVDVYALGSNGNSALHYAAFYGHLATLEFLLESGAHVDTKSDDDGPGSVGCTPLALAAGSFYANDRGKVIELLTKAGADPNARNHAGNTPLMYAVFAHQGYPDSVQALISVGADLDLCDPRGNTALMMAIIYKNEEIIELLKQAGASLDGVESVLLQNAANDGDLAAVQQILSENTANVNHRYTSSALSKACMYGHTEVVAALLDAGADVNLPDDHGSFSPLIRAANSGHFDVVKLLLDAGADVTAQVDGVGTSLDFAKQRRKKNAKVIELLEAVGTPSS